MQPFRGLGFNCLFCLKDTKFVKSVSQNLCTWSDHEPPSTNFYNQIIHASSLLFPLLPLAVDGDRAGSHGQRIFAFYLLPREIQGVVDLGQDHRYMLDCHL